MFTRALGSPTGFRLTDQQLSPAVSVVLPRRGQLELVFVDESVVFDEPEDTLGECMKDEMRRRALDCRTVLIVIDDSPESRQILDAATALATPRETQFVVLHVVSPICYVMDTDLLYGFASGPRDEQATGLVVARAKRDAARVALTLTRRSVCNVDSQVIVSDRPGLAIVDCAQASDVDVIAMTARGQRVSGMLLGSVTEVVRRTSRLPMLVLRPMV